MTLPRNCNDPVVTLLQTEHQPVLRIGWPPYPSGPLLHQSVDVTSNQVCSFKIIEGVMLRNPPPSLPREEGRDLGPTRAGRNVWVLRATPS